jgi:toxin secretion/phage lysis holin|nr:MAG TPA: holin [Caudoviricetes sp.]
MENGITMIKVALSAIVGWLLGGWDTALQTLVVFMALDYFTGMAVAGIFKNSPKTNNGAAETRAGLKGLVRKIGILILVMIVARLEMVVHNGVFCRNAIIIFLITNESLSVLENLGLMGVKYPAWLKNGLEVLLKKTEDRNEENGD